MGTFKTKVGRFLVGALSFFIMAALLLGLYSYLDLQRLNEQRAYQSPEEAFLASLSHHQPEITSSRRCSVILAGHETWPLEDLWFVTGHYTKDGQRKAAGTLFLHLDSGWVRVSETSPTPLLVCAARKLKDGRNLVPF
jgi:hypothetical protein